MKTLSAYLHRRASWWALLPAFAFYMLFNAFLLPRAEESINRAAGQRVGIIDLGMGFDLEKIKQQVAAYGVEGRDLYRHTEITMDVIYPLAYAVFFSLLISLLMRGLAPDSRLKQANVLPFITEGFDLLENVFLVLLLSGYPDMSNTTVLLVAVFRTLKWLSFALIFVLILFLLGKRLFRRRSAVA